MANETPNFGVPIGDGRVQSASDGLAKHVASVFPPASTIIALSEVTPFSEAVGESLRARGFGVVEESADAVIAYVDLIDLGDDGAMWVFTAKNKTTRQRLNRQNGSMVAASAVTVRE